MSITSVLGDSQSITITVRVNDALLDLTGYSATFRATSKVDGTSITKTTGSGITLATQSGATLGQLTVAIVTADYPASWLTTAYGSNLKAHIELEIVNGATRYTPLQDVWILRGQLVT